MKKRYFVFIFFLVVGNIFAQVPQSELWKNKILYIGGSFGLGPIIGQDRTVLGGNLSPLQIDWQITKFLSLGSGLNFYFAPETKYIAPKQTDPDSGILETYAGMETHILFPLLLQFTYRPSIFSIELGGGLYVAPVVMNTMVERTNDNGYTVAEAYGKNLFSVDQKNPFGFIVSGSFGVKVGQGILFLDLSYLRDFSEISVKFNGERVGHHLWNMLAVNIGFKYGLFNTH
jgi:hypothetical protein